MRLPALFSFLFLLLSPTIHAAVLAIDYGAEFTKLSLVKPGVPLDVVLDRDSKRKVQSVVGWKKDDRVFGQEGKMAATRFPDTHFPYVKPLLGSSSVAASGLYPNPPSISSDGTIIFPHPKHPSHLSPAPSSSAEVWTPTALLAHQLAYYRTLAEELAGSNSVPETITQVIVTVPAWWNQYQRKAYRDALELQGMTCLAMIGEGTGVALNYAMTRSFPDFDPITGQGEKEYHLIYDSGALATTATVVAFYQTSELPSPKAKTPIYTTHIEVLGTGWQEIGGVALDTTIQEILVSDFIEKTGKTDIREDKRAIAKLAKEANRVKHILSANQQSNVNVESLHDDIDYKSRLSRTDLEDALLVASPLFSSPITNALSSANLGLDDLTSIILFGGNTRVPFVQTAIRSVLTDAHIDKIAQNVNTDEAAVLGAAYYGASLSRQFKMKQIEVAEKSLEDFTMNGQVIFPQGSKLGEKKSFTLPESDEVLLDFAQASKPLFNVQLVDIPSATADFTSPSPVINITVRLDSRGHVAVANAALVSNVTETEQSGGVAGALKGLFGKKDKEAKGEDDQGEDDGVDEILEQLKEVAKDKRKTKAEKAAIKFREKYLGIKPMTGEEKRATMARLISIASFESAKAAREEARNLLEGYLYRLQSFLDPGSETRALHDFSTPEERETLSRLLKETFEWLGDNAEGATEKVLKAKRAALETLEEPIVVRFSERQTRGKAIEDFQQAMFAARAFFVEANKNNTLALEAAEQATPEKPVAPPKYTQDELNVVEELLKDYEVWMDTRMEKQVKIENDPIKDPEIYTKDLNERGKKLQNTVLRLVNKKAPRAPRPSTSTTASTSTSTSTSSSPSEAESSVTSSTSISTSPIPIASEETIPRHEEL